MSLQDDEFRRIGENTILDRRAGLEKGRRHKTADGVGISARVWFGLVWFFSSQQFLTSPPYFNLWQILVD